MIVVLAATPAAFDAKECVEINDDRTRPKARRARRGSGAKDRSLASKEINLRRRPDFSARRRHGWLADGTQEVLESNWRLGARQHADEFTARFGATQTAQNIDCEDAAQELPAPFASARTAGRPSLIDA